MKIKQRRGDSDEEYEQRKKPQESSLTVKAGVVLTVVIVISLSIYGFFFSSVLNHESRITAIETSAGLERTYVKEALIRIENIATDTNKAMHDHMENSKR